ncbi:PDDEXK nuclease domain-containing protein [Murimonas intestini]|uniref:PDDEXK nuclease domain-containing protein n=1 Tax=Murimonas intestini TaxID=1337051 RepID=UPI000D6D7E38
MLQKEFRSLAQGLSGKMNFYLSVVDAQLKSESDNPSIGLILCRKYLDNVE